MSGKRNELSLVKYVQLFYESILLCIANQKKSQMVQRSFSIVWNKWVLIKDRHLILNRHHKAISIKRKQANAAKFLDKWLLYSDATVKAERKVANHHLICCLEFAFKTWLENASRIKWPKMLFLCIQVGILLQKRTNKSLRKKILSWLIAVQRTKDWAAFSLKYSLLWKNRKLDGNTSCLKVCGKQKGLLWSLSGLIHGFDYTPTFKASKFKLLVCSHPSNSFKLCSESSINLNQFTCSFCQASKKLYLNSYHITTQFERLIEIAVAFLIRKRLLIFVYQCWCTFLYIRQERGSQVQKISLRQVKRAMENWICAKQNSSVLVPLSISNWSIFVKCVLLASKTNQAGSRSCDIHGKSETGRVLNFTTLQAEKMIHLQSGQLVRLLFLVSKRPLLSSTILRWRIASVALEHQRQVFRHILIGIVSTGHKSCLRAVWNLWRVRSKDSQTWRLQETLQRQTSTVESLLHIINIQSNITVPPQVECCKDLAARPDP
jgi:hypothetical protein